MQQEHLTQIDFEKVPERTKERVSFGMQVLPPIQGTIHTLMISEIGISLNNNIVPLRNHLFNENKEHNNLNSRHGKNRYIFLLLPKKTVKLVARQGGKAASKLFGTITYMQESYHRS